MKCNKWMKKKCIPAIVAACLCVGAPRATPVWASDKTVETTYLGEPDYVYWETDTIGRWSSVSKAKEYQVKLYKADNIERDEENPRMVDWKNSEMEAVMTVRTTELSFDFSEYMEDLHSYFFVVRAVPRLNEQACVSSGSWVASPNVDFAGRQVLGITDGKWRNYLEGSKYEDGDGDILVSGWQLIRGTWYLFDDQGYRQSGWQSIEGDRYYLSEDGKLATGWFVWHNQWYYAGKDGVIQTGWVMIKPGEYYYFYEDGRMASGVEINGYWVDESGKSVR